MSVYLPTLYTQDSKGEMRSWKTWVVGYTVHREYGRVGRKMTRFSYSVSESSVSAHDRALHVARVEWGRRVDRGYAPAESDADGMRAYREHAASKKTAVVPVFKAMALRPWDDACAFNFDYARGVYVHPYVGGTRCTARMHAAYVHLSTHTGKPVCGFDDIRTGVRVFTQHNPDITLDGDVYAETFTTSTCRDVDDDERKSIIADAFKTSKCVYDSQFRYHVFDCYVHSEPELTQTERWRRLDFMRSTYTGTTILVVPVHRVYTVPEIKYWHDVFVRDGYEGAVVRDGSLVYMPGKRPQCVRVYKFVSVEECVVTGANEDSNGQVVWVCDFRGKSVHVTPRGSKTQRREWYRDRYHYIGKLLTLRYQTLDVNGLPRFPVGVRFSNYTD